MRVTALQIEIRDGEPAANLQHALDLLQQAPSADVYLLPELFTTGYAQRIWDETADTHTPETVERLLRFAREHSANVVAGTIARNDDGKLVNRLWNLSSAGATHYDKMHLIAAFREPELLARGTQSCHTQIADCRAHLSICFDLRFPELYRQAALAGAEAFLVISEWPAQRAEALITLARARAMENQAFLVLCNRTGTARDGTAFDGRSQIFDPEGKVIAQAEPGEGYCSASLDPSIVRDLRERFPVLSWSLLANQPA